MPKYGGTILTFFETVKNSVTVKQAAEHYGCKVNRGDMICCPFHDDRHPSMKLNEDYFYCFGCGTTGDVIDFVAWLFGLSSYEAAKKLAYDFGMDPDKPPAAMALKKPYPLARAFRNDEMHCQRVLCDYLHLLERWKVEYAPGAVTGHMEKLCIGQVVKNKPTGGRRSWLGATCQSFCFIPYPTAATGRSRSAAPPCGGRGRPVPSALPGRPAGPHGRPPAPRCGRPPPRCASGGR